MSRRAKRGEVGSRERKGKENDKMKGKGRASFEEVGPRAGPSRAARDGHARVPKFAPFHHFEPWTVFSHPDRSSPNPGMPIWIPEGLARKPRRTTQQPWESAETEKIRGGKIESFILCPTFLVPRNAEQRRGNCHNPIFTHGIFSGVGMQNGTAWTELA
jgi:hypothetical protein